MKKEKEFITKAEKREIKKRPRMKKSGYGLRKDSRFAGMKLSKIKRKT